MSLSPSPSASRGEVVLQPSYFTSSIYVDALRQDITELITTYNQRYVESVPAQPFALFKEIWCFHGWKWLHLKVFDSRTRETFLNVTLRLFLERTNKSEALFTRVAGLFGLYTFFYTQPMGVTPPLHSVKNIPIQNDVFSALKCLTVELTAPLLAPLRPHTHYVMSVLLKDDVFFILPDSTLGAQNPRQLPREIYVEEEEVGDVNDNEITKKGRPAKRTKTLKTRVAVERLEGWMDAEGPIGVSNRTIEEEAGRDKRTIFRVVGGDMTSLDEDGSLVTFGKSEKSVVTEDKEEEGESRTIN